MSKRYIPDMEDLRDKIWVGDIASRGEKLRREWAKKRLTILLS